MLKKRAIYILFLFSFMILTAACSSTSSTPAAPAKADPKETVTKAYQKLVSCKSYHMSMETTTAAAVGDKKMTTVVKGEFDMENSPMLGKSTLVISSDATGQKNEQKILQYFEESGDQLIMYSNMNNQWMKQSIPKGGYNPVGEYENYIKAIISVTEKSDTDAATVYEVIAGGDYLKENIKKNLSGMSMQKPLSDEMLKDLGNLTYLVTVDKKTGSIAKVDIDLSDFMKTLGASMAKSSDVPEEQKKTIKDTFANMKLTTSSAFSQFDAIEKIVIPAEAKK